MMRPMLLAGVAMLFGCQVRADTPPKVVTDHGMMIPQPCEDDPRVLCVEHDPNRTVQLYAAPGATLRIELAQNETIKGVIVSDEATLGGEDETPPDTTARQAEAVGSTRESTCDRNLCRSVKGRFAYLMPRAEMVPQPIFLQSQVCDDAGKCHDDGYIFELRTRPGDMTVATPNTYFGVRFLYSARDAAAAKAAAAARWQAQQAARDAAAQDRADNAPPPASLPGPHANFRYLFRGSEDVKPDRIWDDGRTTFIRFLGNRRLPVVYVTLPDKRESEISYAPEPDASGNTIRIPKTARRWCLRDGDVAGCVYNVGSDPDGRFAPTIADPQGSSTAGGAR